MATGFGIAALILIVAAALVMIRTFLLAVISFDERPPGRMVAMRLSAAAALFAVGLVCGLHARDMRISRHRSSSRQIVALAAAAETRVHDRYGRYSTSVLDLEAVSPRFAAADRAYAGTVSLSRSDVTNVIYIGALNGSGQTQAQLQYRTAASR